MAGLKFTYRFIPLRFSPKTDKFVGLVLTIYNNTDEEKLVSFDLEIKTKGLLGFDQNAIHKRAIKKVGKLIPGEKREIMVKIYGTNATKANDYDIEIVLNEHYLDYDKILTRYKKEISLRVV